MKKEYMTITEQMKKGTVFIDAHPDDDALRFGLMEYLC
jgi:hypothetical protein